MFGIQLSKFQQRSFYSVNRVLSCVTTEGLVDGRPTWNYCVWLLWQMKTLRAVHWLLSVTSLAYVTSSSPPTLTLPYLQALQGLLSLWTILAQFDSKNKAIHEYTMYLVMLKTCFICTMFFVVLKHYFLFMCVCVFGFFGGHYCRHFTRVLPRVLTV